MIKVTFQLETITPLFMYGADQRTPEIRPPSIKGLIRYWWRAAKGCYFCGDINRMKKKEEEIFGGTKAGAKYKLKVINNGKGLQKVRYPLLPHREDRRVSLESFKPTQSINLEFEFYDTTNKDEILTAFKISVLLGSFGKRARRGFGSLWIKDGDRKIINDVISINTPQNFLKAVMELLNKLAPNCYEIKDGRIINKKLKSHKCGCNFPVIEEVLIGRRGNWHNLLRHIGGASSTYRDPSLGSGSPRMASPVWVSIKRIGDDHHIVIVKLLPRYPRNYPRVNYSQLNNFVRRLR